MGAQFDTHQLFAVASAEDMYSVYYTNLYGVLAWLPLAALPERADRTGWRRHECYESELAGRPVLDTLRSAFDALAALLPQ